jgi:hypothetical protein
MSGAEPPAGAVNVIMFASPATNPVVGTASRADLLQSLLPRNAAGSARRRGH